MKSTSKLLVLLVIIIVIGAIAWKTLGSQETTPTETKAAESTAQTTSTQESAPATQENAPATQEASTTEQNTAAPQEPAAAQTEAATNSTSPATTTETPAADNTSGELTCDKADKIVTDIFDMRVGNKSLDEALAYLQNTASLPEQELNAFAQFARGLWGVPIEKIDAKQQVAVFHEQCITLAQQAQQAAQQAEQAAQTEQAKPEQQAPAAQ